MSTPRILAAAGPSAAPAGTEPIARLVIVPCGKAKRDSASAAGELYTGSYHRAAMRAAQALAERSPGMLVAILSAKYGLLTDLSAVIEPYDVTAGHAGAITPVLLRRQVEQRGLARAEVTVLAGRRYVELARSVWPAAAAPLEGAGGMGLQLQRLARIAAGEFDLLGGRGRGDRRC